MTTIAPRVVPCSVQPSDRLRRSLAGFGLGVRRAEGRPPATRRGHLDRMLALESGEIALVTGASGTGKSTLLRALHAALEQIGATAIDADDLLARATPDAALPDLLPLPRAAALRSLARAGLGDALLWARTIPELSRGERARLALALAFAHAESQDTPPSAAWITVDECCSTLDRATARTIARAIRRWTTGSRGVRVVCATAHDDLADHLDPDRTTDTDPPRSAA